MKPAVYILDTNSVVFWGKGLSSSRKTLQALSDPLARLVVPSYVFEEIQRDFTTRLFKLRDHAMKIPPSPLLRLVLHCSNVRILPRGPATLALEFRLAQETKNRKARISK
jgi:hypothetical protein